LEFSPKDGEGKSNLKSSSEGEQDLLPEGTESEIRRRGSPVAFRGQGDFSCGKREKKRACGSRRGPSSSPGEGENEHWKKEERKGGT